MKCLTRSALAAVLLLAVSGCGNDKVASTYVVSKDITAASGGTIEVTSADSADLAGTRIEIPAGALSADTRITVALDKEAIATAGEEAGPVAELGPSGTTFATPAKVTLPFKLSAAQKAGNLYVQVLEDGGARSTLTATVDSAASRLTFSVAHFTRYQAAAHPACSADSACASGEACLDGVCVKQTFCTPGSDQTCNGNAAVSALWGHCETDGTCTCKAGFALDATTGKCQPASCASDADCGEGLTCVDGACELGCAAGQTLCSAICVDLASSASNCGQCGLACSPGMVCSFGVCIAGPACATDADCGAGQVCQAGQCSAVERTCEEAGGVCGALTAAGVVCDAGYALVGSAGTCAPGGGCCMPVATTCSADSACAVGEVCLDGVCVIGCEAAGGRCSALTSAGVLCDAGYASADSAGACGLGAGCCMPTLTCESDADCGTAYLCLAGSCVLSCEAAGGTCAALTADGVTCDAGFVAVGSAGACAVGAGCCMPTYTTCSADADCLDSKVCVAGLCQGGCAGGQTLCDGLCVDLASNVGNCGACATACASGETCTAGLCTAGVACSADADCDAGEACVSGFCVASALTCEAAGGTCGALTAAGIVCPVGTAANGSAGTCAIGGSCCTPLAATCASDADCLLGELCDATTGTCLVTCETVGGRCAVLDSSGVATCEAGYAADASAGACVSGASCCVPAVLGCSADVDCASGQLCVAGVCEIGCEAMGGSCGSLTSAGVVCAEGYLASPATGACGVGGVCCLPDFAACSMDVDCASGQVCLNGMCQ